MKNKKIVYFCQECGNESSKWMGQCPACKAWNTMVEETVTTTRASGTKDNKRTVKREPVGIREISLA